MSVNMNRRKFIGNSAVAAAAITIIPRHVLGGTGFVAANDRINLGFIGTGKQVYTLLDGIGKCKETIVLACSDVDSKKLEKFKNEAVSSNKAKSLSATVDSYKYYRELLNRKDIDAVVIATPDHWHAQVAIDAAKAGKDIYCEKPMALTVAEGRAMVNATRKYNRVFQTGNMQRSWRDFRHAVELVRNGYIGELKEINVNVGEPVRQCDLPSMTPPAELDWNEWVGPSFYRGWHPELAPVFGDDKWAWWRGYRDFGGGYITDWGAHMFDIAQWGLGMDRNGPVEISPIGDGTEFMQFKYANGVLMTSEPFDEGKTKGVKFIGKDGWIEVARGMFKASDDKFLPPAKAAGDTGPYETKIPHQVNFIEAVRERKDPAVTVEIGHSSCTVCNLGNIACELKRTIKWNPATETFVDDADGAATKLMHYEYRSGWKLL